VLAHKALAKAIAPIPLALGEHVPNRVMFKHFMQASGVCFVQVDCTRVALACVANQAGMGAALLALSLFSTR
jgi:L-alanine-DL-glutamate epimerase-like enolase superfamily enzyme